MDPSHVTPSSSSTRRRVLGSLAIVAFAGCLSDGSQQDAIEEEILERYQEAYEQVQALDEPLQEAFTAYDAEDYETVYEELDTPVSIEQEVADVYHSIDDEYRDGRFEDEDVAEAALRELSFATGHWIWDARHAAASLSGQTNDPYEDDEAHEFIEKLRTAYEDGEFDILPPDQLTERD